MGILFNRCFLRKLSLHVLRGIYAVFPVLFFIVFETLEFVLRKIIRTHFLKKFLQKQIRRVVKTLNPVIMLKSLNFSQLLSFDLYDLARISLQVFDHCVAHKPELGIFIEDVRTCLHCYEETFQRRVISCVMERKTLQASKRDEAYIAFYRFVEASCHRPSKKHGILSAELLSVLQKHTWQSRNDGYQIQSSCLPSLIRELDQHYLELIDQLGASEWFDDLVKAQADFDGLSDEKKIGAYKEISVRETRPLLESALRSLFWITDRLYQSAPDEELGQVVRNLNNVVKKLTSKVEAEICAEALSAS